MSGYNYMTPEGYEKVRAELEEMKTTDRQQIASEIAEAREKGDLSENAEYHAAKEAQGLLEMRINELEKSLANVKLIEESELDTSVVTILNKVTIKNTKNNKELSYKLVSNSEADLKAGKISIDSPIGQGLLGKKVGDLAEIKTPAGVMQFEVVDIAF